MKVSLKHPPNWEDIKKTFHFGDNKKAYFAYGDTCYNPMHLPMTPEKIRHEETHLEQMRFDNEEAKFWWDRYLHDEEFRIEQEAEAYAEEYKLYCQREKDRNKRTRYLHAVADQLASDLYGTVITEAAARIKILELSI